MPQPTESLLDFPVGGLDESRAYVRQKKFGGDDGTVYTTADALNVRGFDALGRRRGGARPGQQRYLYPPINHPTLDDPHSIQDLAQLIGGNANPTATFGPFVFAAGEELGFGLGSTAGASYYTNGVGTFYCSCWDKYGNAYITEKEIGKDFSRTNVYRIDSAGSGVEVWSSQQNDFPVRGMAVIGEWLYFATDGPGAGESQIFKFAREDGTPFPSESGFADPWMTTADNANLLFSTGAVNCLAAVGRFLGAVVCGDGASVTDNFVVIDTESATPATFFSSTGTQGTTTTDQECKADSDGKFFYASLCAGNNKVQQIAPDGTVVWTFTAGGTDHTIAYDRAAHRLFVLDRDSGQIEIVNCSSGALMGTVRPNSSDIWREIDCDGSGNVILWANNTVGGDVYAANKSNGRIWGPNTFAEADHSGASSFRADKETVLVSRSRLLAMSGGRLSTFDRTTATPVTNPRLWSPTVEVIFSAQLGAHMYYADGVDYARYNGFTGAGELVRPLVASEGAGEMPIDAQGRMCRLVEMWRKRLVLSGLPDEPQNWFMSRVDDALNWEYGPDFPDGLEAIAGNNAPMGLIGDDVNTVIPYNDDICVFGCAGSIWVMSGDPADGGTLLNASRLLGMAWGRPWCRGPDGTLFFFGSRGQVYNWQPGTKVFSWVSQQVQRRMDEANVGQDVTSIRMVWDDREKGLHLWLTPFDFTTHPVEHWFWDSRVNAWWPVEYAHRNFNPKCCLAVVDDASDDRVVLVGSWDSHVRSLDNFVDGKDDGLLYRSHVALGPFLTHGLGELTVHELQASMDEDSADVEYEILTGRTAQKALSSEPVQTGVFAAGRGITQAIRRSGNGLYLRLVCRAGNWAMEQIRAKIEDRGNVLRRN